MSKKRKVHEGHDLNSDFIMMTMPLLAIALFLYGPRVLILALVAGVTAKVADRFAAMLRSRKYDSTENSSTMIAMIITLMLPASVGMHIVIVAVLVGVLVGKEAFGGAGGYPFNPAAVGYCMAAVSWPEQIFRYPQPINWVTITDWSWQGMMSRFRFEGAALLEGPSTTLKNGGIPNVQLMDLLLGYHPGPLGATCVIVIISCAVFLCVRKRLPLAAPLSFLLTVALFAFLFPRVPQGAWRVLPWHNWESRLISLQYEALSGGIVFASVFLVGEPCTLPKNTKARVIYGALLGFAVVMFRYYGTYELGTCFALLMVNAVSGYFDRALATHDAKKEKGEKKREGKDEKGVANA